MTSAISTYPVCDEDECYQIRGIGVMQFEGVVMSVELQAFSATMNGMVKNDYDWARADVHLSPVISDDLPEHFANDNALAVALRKFLEEHVEGESDVSWAESGAQSSDELVLSRN